MGWASIGRVLPGKIKVLGLERFFWLAELKSGWDGIIVKAAGEKFVGRSQLANLKNNALIVDCLNSVWASELRLREARLLAEIKKASPQLKIEKISFIS